MRGNRRQRQLRLCSASPDLLLFFPFIFLLLAVLGLFAACAFSSCGKPGLLTGGGAQPSHCGGFSCCRAQAQSLWHRGLAAPQHVGSSQIRERTHVSPPGKPQSWSLTQASAFLFFKGITVPCLVAQLCPTLRGPLDCGLPGSSLHGIFQARILEWVTISISRGSSWPWDRTRVSCLSCQRLAAGLFTTSTTWEAQMCYWWTVTSLEYLWKVLIRFLEI